MGRLAFERSSEVVVAAAATRNRPFSAQELGENMVLRNLVNRAAAVWTHFLAPKT